MTRRLVLALFSLALAAPSAVARSAQVSAAAQPAVVTPSPAPGPAPSTPQPAAKRSLSLDDLARQRSVGDPQVSSDGKWVAYTVGTIDAEKDKRDTDLWMASWDGQRQVRLTSSPESSESRPRWSPDGRFLAFLAARGDEAEKKKGAQVWLLNTAGGEAEKLTDLKGGVEDLAWSPDSKKLALIVSDPDPADDEKADKKKSKTVPPIVIDRYHFKQDRDGYLRDLRSRLWLFELEAKKGEALCSGPYDDSAPAWSPDGTKIAFVSHRGPDPDRDENSDIFVIEAKAGSEPRAITTFVGSDEGRPSWSPDGKLIAYAQGDETRWSAYQLAKLAVVPADGSGPARVLTASLDRPVYGQAVWSQDGRALTTLVADDRTAYVARVPVDGGPVEKLTKGPRSVSSLSLAPNGELAVLAATDEQLPEVHVLEKGALRALSHQNDSWLSEIRLGTTEDFSSKSADGTEVHSLLLKPAGFEAGRKYPLLLIVHGGPNGQDSHAFSFDKQFLAGQGYVVLAVNYRGSNGRGAAYQRAIFADWGHHEVVDLLGAVDAAVRAGVADPDRLGLGGWSYGGILTDYTIATDGRFKAAISGAGSALQLSMYGSDQYIVQYENELGPPWKSPEAWMKVSYPFFKADRIKTPTLYMGGEKDFNVPIVGSEQMYQALRSQGVPTQLVVYPGQFHGITTPSYVKDRLQRWLGWFDKYLKPTPTPAAGS